MPVKRLFKGDAAPSGVVYDDGGQPVHLDDCWAEGPVLLTFLRHFG